MDQWTSLLAPQLRALEQLVAHDGHMTRAAESLGIPQSSMSRRIHALEKSLGVCLVVKDGRTVTVTPAAIALGERTRSALRELDAVVESIAGETDPDHGVVRFGFPLTMGSGQVPTLIAEFHRRVPGIRLVIKQAHGSELVADLSCGVLDVAVVIPPSSDVQHVVVGTQSIRAVLPSRHRLASRRRLRLEELRDETFIANPTSFNLRSLTETWCREAGFEPLVAVEISQFATIRELIGRGMGVALLPAGRSAAKVVEVPLSARYEREVALAWSPTAVTPASGRLLTFLRSNLGH